MAVSKRLRYEILRRDNHTCRYCGGRAPDVVLTVDHVQPTALGGTDLPENLVAACKDCNAGKTSVKPDDHLVAEVSEDAKRWHERMQYALSRIGDEIVTKRMWRNEFELFWNGYTMAGQPIQLPPDWRQTVDHWMALGTPYDVLTEAVEIAMAKPNLRPEARWKYACGVVWRTLDKARAEAEEAVEPEEDLEDDDAEQKYFQEQTAKHWNDGFDHARAFLEFADLPMREYLWRHVDGVLGRTEHYNPPRQAVA